MAKAKDADEHLSEQPRTREKPEIYKIIRGGHARLPGRRRFLTGALATTGLLVSAGEHPVRAAGGDPLPSKKGIECGGACAHRFEVTGIAVSPDGKTLISCSNDEMIKLWSFPEGRLIHTLEGHREAILCMALSPNGQHLITGDEKGEVRLWIIRKKKPERSKFKKVLSHHTDIVEAAAISPDSKFAVTADIFGTFVVWSLPDGGKITSWKGPNRVDCVAFSPDGKIFAAVGADHKLDIWSFEKENLGTLLRSIDIGEWNDAVLFSPDGKRLVTRYWLDSRLRIWNTDNWTQEKYLGFDDIDVEALAFSPDGSILAGGRQVIKIWNFPSMKTKATIPEGGGNAVVMTFSPDGIHLVTGNWSNAGGQIKIWDHAKKKKGLQRCLIDLEAIRNTEAVSKYSYTDAKGRKITVTLPNCACAPQLPEVASCVCDTVNGSYCPCQPVGGGCPWVYYYPN